MTAIHAMAAMMMPKPPRSVAMEICSKFFPDMAAAEGSAPLVCALAWEVVNAGAGWETGDAATGAVGLLAGAGAVGVLAGAVGLLAGALTLAAGAPQAEQNFAFASSGAPQDEQNMANPFLEDG